MNTFVLHLWLCGATLELLDASKINGWHRTSPVELKSSWQCTLLRQTASLSDCETATLTEALSRSGWSCVMDGWNPGVLQRCAAFMLRLWGAAGWAHCALWRVCSASKGVYGLQPPLQPCIALLQALLLLLPPPLRSVKLWDEYLHTRSCDDMLPSTPAAVSAAKQSSAVQTC